MNRHDEHCPKYKIGGVAIALLIDGGLPVLRLTVCQLLPAIIIATQNLSKEWPHNCRVSTCFEIMHEIITSSF